MTHRNNFDALRLIAALTVLVSHQFLFTGQDQPTPYSDIPLGQFGVYVFFSISGYLVSASWRRDPSLGRFLIRRALRIVPGLLVVMGVVEAVLMALGIESFTMNPVSEPNGSLWTIPIEVQCYLLFALGAVIVRRGALPFLLILLACLLHRYSFLVCFGSLFAAGAFLDQYPKLRRATPLLVVLGMVALHLMHNPYLGLSLIIAPLSVWFGTQSWPIVRDVGRYGDFSYGVYLYACFVQQLAVMWLDLSFTSLLTVSILVTFVCAWASWRFVESPAMTLRQHLSFRPRWTSRSDGVQVGNVRIA